jgi:hypothetical protein
MGSSKNNQSCVFCFRIATIHNAPENKEFIRLFVRGTGISKKIGHRILERDM